MAVLFKGVRTNFLSCEKYGNFDSSTPYTTFTAAISARAWPNWARDHPHLTTRELARSERLPIGARLVVGAYGSRKVVEATVLLQQREPLLVPVAKELDGHLVVAQIAGIWDDLVPIVGATSGGPYDCGKKQ